MYIVWHHKTKVMVVDEGKVTVLENKYLPFDFKHYDTVTYQHFLSWMSRRLNTLNRTYMNQLYKQRRIGRSHVDIINDSGALSPVDLFWITRPHLPHTWDSLQVLRDESMSLAKVSLEGIIDPSLIFVDKKDHTSIFSTKGAFPKGIYDGYLVKKNNNAEFEISGYRIGKHLDISVAHAEMWQDGIVACKLFTDMRNSLTHIIECVYPFDPETYQDKYARSIDFIKQQPALVKQLQRLYVLAYLTINHDLHEENFGFLYDTVTFELTAVAPAFDFNSAFEAWEPDQFDNYIYRNLGEFLSNNQYLYERLQTLSEVIQTDPYLSHEQKLAVDGRRIHLLSLRTDSREQGVLNDNKMNTF